MWLEIDYTPPANVFVQNITLSGDASQNGIWTSQAQGIGDDNLYATHVKTTTSFAPYYCLNNSDVVVPAGAILRGIQIEVDVKVSVTSSSPTFWLKVWGTADGVYTSGTIAETTERRYVFGSMSDALVRTVLGGDGSTPDSNFYIRFTQSTTTSTTYSLDNITCQVCYELPVTGNALFFGEIF